MRKASIVFLIIAALAIGFSACDNGVSLDGEVTQKVNPIASPQNLRTYVGPGQIVVAWDPVAGADSYDVWRKKHSESAWVRLVAAQTGIVYWNSLGPSATVGQIENGVIYDFKVIALNGSAAGANTSHSEATVTMTVPANVPASGSQVKPQNPELDSTQISIIERTALDGKGMIVSIPTEVGFNYRLEVVEYDSGGIPTPGATLDTLWAPNQNPNTLTGSQRWTPYVDNKLTVFFDVLASSVSTPTHYRKLYVSAFPVGSYWGIGDYSKSGGTDERIAINLTTDFGL